MATNQRRTRGTVHHACRTCRPGQPCRWRIRLSAGWDPDARAYARIDRTITGSRRDAERQLHALANGLDTGQQKAPRVARTVGAALAQYLERTRKLGPRTRDEYERIIATHLQPLHRHPIEKLTPAHIDQRYRELERKGLSPATIRRIHTVLRSALNHAVRWDWIATNPATRVELPDLEKPDVGRVDSATVRHLLEHARQRDPILHLAATLAALTGLRRGELCALRWSDLDLHGGRIHVRHSLADRGSRGTTRKDTKTHRTRVVVLSPPAVALLSAHAAARNAELARLGLRLIQPDDHVVTADPTGRQPWVPSRLSKQWQRHVVRCDLEGVRLHDLRHWYVSTAVNDNVPIPVVAEQAGHSPATLLRDYAHAQPLDPRAAGAAASALGFS